MREMESVELRRVRANLNYYQHLQLFSTLNEKQQKRMDELSQQLQQLTGDKHELTAEEKAEKAKAAWIRNRERTNERRKNKKQ